MDPVLAVLETTNLQLTHIESVCELFSRPKAQDIRLAFQILCRLDKYSKEPNAWAFRLLSQYDFVEANQFELDLANLVYARAQKLLDSMARWPLQALKAKVQRLTPQTDWETVLMDLVLRISTLYRQCEVDLRMALTRATLVRIHCELVMLMDNTSHPTHTDHRLAGPLVEKYKSFVSELLKELEDAPSIDAQERTFKTVADLKGMFAKFKEDRERSPNSTSNSTSTRNNENYPNGEFVPATHKSNGSYQKSIQHSLLSPSVMNAFNDKQQLQVQQPMAIKQFQPQPQPAIHKPQPQLPPQKQPQNKNQNLNVQMIDGRMQVESNGKFIDMQDWLNQANGVAVSKQAFDFKPLQKPASASMGVGLNATDKSNIASSNFLNALKTGRW